MLLLVCPQTNNLVFISAIINISTDDFLMCGTTLIPRVASSKMASSDKQHSAASELVGALSIIPPSPKEHKTLLQH